MMRSMYASVSGLKVHQTMMDVIGNNISNINTLGYKGSRITFKEMLSQTMKGASAPDAERGTGGTNPVEIGLGVSLGSIDSDMSSGNLQPTGKQSDVAIQGDGFFVVNDGKQDFYTRAGSFSFDKEGYLFSSVNGFRVQGWVADEDGNLNNIGPDTVTEVILDKSMNPDKTKNITYNGNLNSAKENSLTFKPQKIKGVIAGLKDNISISFNNTGEYNRYQFNLATDNGSSDFIVNSTIGGGIGDMTISQNTNSTELDDYIISFVDSQDTATGVQSVTIDKITKTITVDADLDDGAGGGAPTLNDLTTAINTQLTTDGFAAQIDTPTVSGTFAGNEADLIEKAITLSGNNVVSGYLTLDEEGNVTSVEDMAGNDLGAASSFQLDVQGTGNNISLNFPAIGASINNTPFIAGIDAGGTELEEMTAEYTLEAERSITANIFDSLGKQHTVNFSLEKIDDDQWKIKETNVEVSDGSRPASGFLGGEDHIISFDDEGNVTDGEKLTFSFDPYGGLETQTIELDFTDLTQFAGNMTADFDTIDGYPQGEFQSFSIDPSGTITGSYSNGQSKVLGKLALAMFSNPAGLSREGGLMSVSNNSGLPRIGQPGVNGRGKLAPGTLEMSNVDLAQQFTEMITAQRGFQASSKVISTSDQMMQQLVNLQR